MARQERVEKGRTRVGKNTRTEVIDQDTRTRSKRESEALAEEMDEILDEIDEVLEQNAQQFVDEYVQRGGE